MLLWIRFLPKCVKSFIIYYQYKRNEFVCKHFCQNVHSFSIVDTATLAVPVGQCVARRDRVRLGMYGVQWLATELLAAIMPKNITDNEITKLLTD